MPVERIEYKAGSVTAKGALVYADKSQGPKPLLLIAPNWLGVTPEAIARAGKMAGDKYVAFVADMYGDGKTVGGPPEAAELANGLRENFKERRARINAALETFVAEASKRGIGDSKRTAAVGFCFGGGNVLELARTGADIAIAISLHGDLKTAAPPIKSGDIRSAILIVHGAADPAVPKADRDAIEAEMEGAGVRWQMHTFGGLLHSFTEEESNVPGIAKFDEHAARQTYRMVDQWATDAFEGRI